MADRYQQQMPNLIQKLRVSAVFPSLVTVYCYLAIFFFYLLFLLFFKIIIRYKQGNQPFHDSFSILLLLLFFFLKEKAILFSLNIVELYVFNFHQFTFSFVIYFLSIRKNKKKVIMLKLIKEKTSLFIFIPHMTALNTSCCELELLWNEEIRINF